MYCAFVCQSNCKRRAHCVSMLLTVSEWLFDQFVKNKVVTVESKNTSAATPIFVPTPPRHTGGGAAPFAWQHQLALAQHTLLCMDIFAMLHSQCVHMCGRRQAAVTYVSTAMQNGAYFEI